MRDDLLTLLEEMAYKITTVESETDVKVKNKMSEAGRYLDTVHQLAIEPPINTVATPPHKGDVYTLGGGMDTEDNLVSKLNLNLSKLNKELKQKLSRYLSILRGDELGEKELNCSF